MFIYTQIFQYRCDKKIIVNVCLRRNIPVNQSVNILYKHTKHLSPLIVRFVSVFTTETNRLDRNR